MDLNVNIFKCFDKQWALLTAGTEEDYNTMTISWGAMGTLWGKPAVTVYVKPIRYTHSFMEKNEYFTVSFYAEDYKPDLGVLGSKSGRDGDKVALTGLTPQPVEGKSMTFKEAQVTLLCRKMYHQDLVRENMPEAVVERSYTTEEPHRMYIGEVIDILRSE